MNKTGIEWCDLSWNPITGCTPVSEGCAHCYAARMAKRLAGQAGYPKDDPFRVTFHEDRMGEPLHLKKPGVIFVCSMGDLFHEDVRAEWWVKIFGVMAKKHTFVVLTKRPAQMWQWLEDFTPLPNVRLGVSAENQARLDERMSHLMRLGAAGWHTVVSLEPLLGPVDVKPYLPPRVTPFTHAEKAAVRCVFPHGLPPNSLNAQIVRQHLGGVILGGETGPGARPMDLDWARRVRDDCAEAGVPFFLKQLDGKKNRVLDGRTHDELPWKTKEKP